MWNKEQTQQWKRVSVSAGFHSNSDSIEDALYPWTLAVLSLNPPPTESSRQDFHLKRLESICDETIEEFNETNTQARCFSAQKQQQHMHVCFTQAQDFCLKWNIVSDKRVIPVLLHPCLSYHTSVPGSRAQQSHGSTQLSTKQQVKMPASRKHFTHPVCEKIAACILALRQAEDENSAQSTALQDLSNLNTSLWNPLGIQAPIQRPRR